MSDTETSEQLDTRLTNEFDREAAKIEKNKQRRKYNQVKGVVGAHHRFSQRLFDKYDIRARDKVKQVLADFVKDNPDRFKQDLIINSPSCKYKYLEIQVCSNWVVTYPWDTVWIYARKAVYLDGGNTTLFLTLNNSLTKALLFDIRSITKTKPRRLKRYSREFVYDIPWNRVLKVDMGCLDKETIELY